MSINLIKQVTDLFGNEFVSKSATALGESEVGISKGLGAVIPSVFAALTQKSSTSGLASLFNLIPGENGFDLSAFLSSFFGGGDNTSLINKSAPLLTSLFGDKLGGLTSAISGFSGLKGASVTTLLASVVPSILAFIKKFKNDNNYTDAQVQGLLLDQKQYLNNAIPTGFNLSNVLGLAATGAAASSAAPRPTSTSSYSSQSDNKGGSSLWIWLLLLVLAGLLIWYFSKGCKDKDVVDTTVVASDTLNKTVADVQENVSEAATTVMGKLDSFGNWIADWGNETTIKLPDGTELKVGENSTEYKLYKFITDDNFKIDEVDKTKNWVSFDRVYFETGKAVLTQESQKQVKNIALILKNFPNASINIGGYTDNTGSAEVNKRVSDERAKAVAKELQNLGAAANQIAEAVGYGPEHPVCPANDTKECQAQNRRVDLKLVAK